MKLREKHMKQFSYASTLAAALVAAGLLAVPTAQAAGACVDSVTAGGWIEVGPDLFANFGLNAEQNLTTGELTGELNYDDENPQPECHVVSTDIVSYTILSDTCREIVYDVTVNGEPGFTADVIVCDNGESVLDPADTFSITVTNTETGEIVGNCTVAETPLANGDVQVHPAHGNCL